MELLLLEALRVFLREVARLLGETECGCVVLGLVSEEVESLVSVSLARMDRCQLEKLVAQIRACEVWVGRFEVEPLCGGSVECIFSRFVSGWVEARYAG